MPAVAIRLLDSLAKVLAYTRSDEQRATLLRQADIIWRAGQAADIGSEDLREIRQRYERLRPDHADFDARQAPA